MIYGKPFGKLSLEAKFLQEQPGSSRYPLCHLIKVMKLLLVEKRRF